MQPGFWYKSKSTDKPPYLHRQLRKAIKTALASTAQERRTMRYGAQAVGLPVSHWVEKVTCLEARAIKSHWKVKSGAATNNSSLKHSILSKFALN